MARVKALHLTYWLALLGVGWGIVLFVSLAVQQNYRQSANDPQLQMAEDSVVALQAGKPPASVVPATKVDASRSLAPFEIIINNQRIILASNATHPTLPPDGVFSDATKRGELLFSWETAAGQRYATVVVPSNNGYVIAARSLTEVERRENNLMLLTAAALVGVGAVVAALFGIEWAYFGRLRS